MADFVSHDHLNGAAHGVVRQRQAAGAGIEVGGLDEAPVAGQIQHVLVELDIGVEDFARARIADVRAESVFGGGRQPADNGVANVFRAVFRVFRVRGAGRALMAWLKPAASKAGSHSSTPF